MLSSFIRVARRSKSLTRASNLLCSVNTRKYHEKVLDHYENPRNVGRLDAKKQNVGTGLVGAPAGCRDVARSSVGCARGRFAFFSSSAPGALDTGKRPSIREGLGQKVNERPIAHK